MNELKLTDRIVVEIKSTDGKTSPQYIAEQLYMYIFSSVGISAELSLATEIIPTRSENKLLYPTDDKFPSENSSQRSKNPSKTSFIVSSCRDESSALSESLIEAGSPSFSKLARTGSEKNESMVLICALPSFSICFCRCLSSGCSAIASARALDIFALSSPAAARVNVTIRRLEISTPSSIMRFIILCVSVKVLPEPAAALTSRVCPRAFIAASCALVKFINSPPVVINAFPCMPTGRTNEWSRTHTLPLKGCAEPCPNTSILPCRLSRCAGNLQCPPTARR